MHNDVTLRVAKEDGRHLVASFLDIWMGAIQERSVIGCQAARVCQDGPSEILPGSLLDLDLDTLWWTNIAMEHHHF